MFGAISKTYYAEKLGIHPSKIFTVSIMPCTAKKFEANREEMNSYGFPDVDAVLTTRELGRLIKSQGIDFVNIEEEEFDAPFGIVSGAGAIFGASGGVMEKIRTEKSDYTFIEIMGCPGGCIGGGGQPIEKTKETKQNKK